MNNPIRTLLVDDHQMFIEGLKAILVKEKSIQIVDQAYSAVEALEILKTTSVDLLITDINMPDMDGIALTKHIKQNFPFIKVLVLTMHNEKSIVAEILLAEAEGYVLKNSSKQELLQAIKNIAEGNTHFCNEVISILLDRIKKQQQRDDETKHLTERELEILNLIVQEFSTAQIAEKLNISPRTVDTHRIHLLEKTKSKTIVGLIKFAFRNGLAL